MEGKYIQIPNGEKILIHQGNCEGGFIHVPKEDVAGIIDSGFVDISKYQ